MPAPERPDASPRYPARGLPPGPGQPRWIQIFQYAFRPIQFLASCERLYGSSFTVRMGSYPPIVFTSDPEVIEGVFRGDPEAFHQANALLRPLVGEASVMTLDGNAHQRERRFMMRAFNRERVRAYHATIHEVVAERMGRWPRGVAFPIHRETQAITLDVILRVVFGLDGEARLDEFRRALLRLLSLAKSRFGIIMLKNDGSVTGERLLRALRFVTPRPLDFFGITEEIDALVYDEIRSRREGGGRGSDVLSQLMAGSDEEGRTRSDRQLRDELVTVLLAGHETTATMLSWITWNLLDNPEVLRRVREEVLAVGGGGPVAADDVQDLEYLDAVVKESMRLNPVQPACFRTLTKPQRVGRWHLPAGVQVAPHIHATHRRGDLWEAPDAYRPERFLARKPTPFHFLPFGGGARTCLGASFATFEMKVVVSELVRRARFRAEPGYRARAVRRNVTYAPSGGVPIVIDSLD